MNLTGRVKIVPEKRLGEPESFPQDKDLILIDLKTIPHDCKIRLAV